MLNKKLFSLLVLTGILALTVMGCSSDDPAAPGGDDSGGGETTGLSVPNFTDAIYDVAPEPFNASEDKCLNDWTSGDYPLLSKAIGDEATDEPMSLYRNLNEIDWIVDLIEEVTADVDAGESFTSTETVTDPEGQNSFSAEIDYHAEGQTVTIPESCRSALGIDSIHVDHFIIFDVPTIEIQYHLGFGSDDNAEWALAWTAEGDEGTDLFYATRDKATNAVNIQGVFWKTMPSEYGVPAQASWIYEIGTSGADNQDFTYNMAWYSYGEFPGEGGTPGSMLGCVNGSGNKNTRFALRYHQYSNGEWSSIDDGTGPFEQLFGPGYTDLNDQWDTYGPALVDVDAMYHNSDIPGGMFPSPYAE